MSLTFIGQAELANGSHFSVFATEDSRGQGFKVVDKHGNSTFAKTYAKAWDSIRYMSKMAPDTAPPSIASRTTHIES